MPAADLTPIVIPPAVLGVSYLLGLPGYQVWRTIAGIEAVSEDEAGPQAVLLGPPPRR